MTIFWKVQIVISGWKWQGNAQKFWRS